MIGRKACDYIDQSIWISFMTNQERYSFLNFERGKSRDAPENGRHRGAHAPHDVRLPLSSWLRETDCTDAELLCVMLQGGKGCCQGGQGQAQAVHRHAEGASQCRSVRLRCPWTCDCILLYLLIFYILCCLMQPVGRRGARRRAQGRGRLRGHR